MVIDPLKATNIKKILTEAQRITDDDPVARWLRGRCPGINPCIFPDLRYHPRLYHSVSRTYHPAMLAIVRGPNGAGITVHRTYLAEGADGVSVRKAFVEPSRMVMPGASLAGGAIRLLPAVGGRVGIAEGIETALAASILHCFPVWSVISASGIASFEPPFGIIEVVVFADNDDAGLIAAMRQTAKTGAYIQHPEKYKQDWNDVLLNMQEVG